MNRFDYVKQNWYLDSKKEIKKSLQKRQLTLEQAQLILENLIEELDKESKKKII